jgi:hypothetical protein
LGMAQGAAIDQRRPSNSHRTRWRQYIRFCGGARPPKRARKAGSPDTTSSEMEPGIMDSLIPVMPRGC